MYKTNEDILRQETMMINTPLSPHPKEYHHSQQEIKLPSRKQKESLLKRYAKKLGLNDRGCYIAVGLAIVAFFFLVIIIAMAACWPSKFRLSSFTLSKEKTLRRMLHSRYLFFILIFIITKQMCLQIKNAFFVQKF